MMVVPYITETKVYKRSCVLRIRKKGYQLDAVGRNADEIKPLLREDKDRWLFTLTQKENAG
jgi:hypothetical protein